MENGSEGMKKAPILFAAIVTLARLSAQDVGADGAPGKSTRPSEPYIEHEFYLPDAMAQPRGLDALEVRADLPGRHPLALLTHGTSSNPTELAEVTPWSFLPQALWFARRGYVALVACRSEFISMS